MSRQRTEPGPVGFHSGELAVHGGPESKRKLPG